MKNIVLITLLSASMSVFAASKTTDLKTKATINAKCSLSVASISFGQYQPDVGSISYSNGSARVTCNRDLAYVIGIDRSQASDPYFNNTSSSLSLGNAAPALLNNSTPPTGTTMAYPNSAALLFNIFTDAARKTVWTGFTNNYPANKQFVSGTGTGFEQTIQIYAGIEKNQYVKPGSYSANMVMTVQF